MDTFYFVPFRASLVAHGLLHEVAHPHEAVHVKPGEGGLGGDAFVELTPTRTVPVLHGPELLLTQSSQILVYLAERYPEAQLLPKPGPALRTALGLLSFFVSDLQPAFRPLLRPEDFLGEGPARDELRERGVARLKRVFGMLEKQMTNGPYLLGAQLSVVDPYVLACSIWSRHVHVEFPTRLAELAQRVAERPAFQRVIALERAAMNG
jgi:glutathione S-transferase